MCPKKRNPRHYGHKKLEHVPEKEKYQAFRSQEAGTCARKREIPGIMVTRSWNMCPKKKNPRHYGHKKLEHVPEKAVSSAIRSQADNT